MPRPAHNYLQDIGETIAYPPRAAEDEKKRLLRVHPEALDILNHYGFAGTEDFTRPFRILALDEGSGDSVIFLAEQLRNRPATLVYLSPSKHAIEQVKARAEIRGLTSIEWVESPLADVASTLGKFDYISCNIALSRVAMPEKALEYVRAALTEEGVCLCMVSGYYGQTGNRQMRELVTRISGENATGEEKLTDVKNMLGVLPSTNWTSRSKKFFETEVSLYGDLALTHLFIEGDEHYYTVPELYQLISKQELHLLDFVTLEGDANIRYMPETTFTSPKIQPYLQGLSRADRQAAAEIVCGSLTKHYCYISHQPKPRLAPQNTRLVPFFTAHFAFPDIYKAIAQHLAQTAEPVITQNNTGHAIRIERSIYTVALCQAMDGKRSIAEMIALLLASPGIPPEASEELLLKEFSKLYEIFHRFDWMLLRAKHVEDFPTVDVMQSRL